MHDTRLYMPDIYSLKVIAKFRRKVIVEDIEVILCFCVILTASPTLTILAGFISLGFGLRCKIALSI